MFAPGEEIHRVSTCLSAAGYIRTVCSQCRRCDSVQLQLLVTYQAVNSWIDLSLQ